VLNGVSLKSAALAEMLSTRRGYAEVVRRDGVHVEYDPRFLLFEFSSNIILRDAQIRLVRSFVAAVDNGESLCHQLIMGAGKTTVIAPLLALILGSPKKLVVQVRYFLIVEFCHVSAGLF
jgi:superfamily II DNA or RNA helicase